MCIDLRFTIGDFGFAAIITPDLRGERNSAECGVRNAAQTMTVRSPSPARTVTNPPPASNRRKSLFSGTLPFPVGKVAQHGAAEPGVRSPKLHLLPLPSFAQPERNVPASTPKEVS